ncbi:flagellar export protein FliJ [Pantoea allii]|uniref:Flagellar FliJ protein n=1 Tax=Pantoea allii TaxID=574096 RepID=A0ABS6V9V5_9GAMM|nr:MULTISPECIES: flagellar export protein FliJ [Pantoea]MBW1212299.1 flagellar export protein FliJ [Pantoea allii]MBW1252875.1 flagellar export protein FliJ [Pantoea allii]MBW1256063.1 flagellar export protein FliJ [Pantoea allii]MBW1262347.1 flagellar export protein FliJ [Pantoea allii]MBW1265140.1 flagellar export protein FliJ [Pantoea allii]
MSKLIHTLEQLHLLRHRAVNDLTRKLASQQRLCQRLENNIHALSGLKQSVQSSQENAVMLSNQSVYKRNLQRVIDWQKQEQALANVEAQKIQRHLLAEFRREKSIEHVMDARRKTLRQAQDQREQKTTDALSTQSWLRQQTSRQK